jgi:hypothetical protein
MENNEAVVAEEAYSCFRRCFIEGRVREAEG